MNQEKVWDNISQKWNKFRVRVSPSVESFVFRKKGRILDLGCGSGQNFIKIKGLKWAAVDFSANMIKFAKKKAKKLRMEIDIQKADSTELPFENDFFDSVLFFAVIHCIDSASKRKKTLQEIFRILRPEGEAMIGTWGSKSERLKNKKKECYIPWTVKGLKKKQMRYTYVYELEELVELCKGIGFEIINSYEDENVIVIVRKPSS